MEYPEDAFSMVSSAVPLVSKYAHHHDAIAALVILQEATRAGTINRLAINKAIAHIDTIRKDPTFLLTSPEG